MPPGNPKDEYLDASSKQRQSQTIRFAQLTVYLALTGSCSTSCSEAHHR
jgi:hypothetical protein